jgi:hypothetical protein
MTYGKHYQISAYVDCMPCPANYQCLLQQVQHSLYMNQHAPVSISMYDSVLSVLSITSGLRLVAHFSAQPLQLLILLLGNAVCYC